MVRKQSQDKKKEYYNKEKAEPKIDKNFGKEIKVSYYEMFLINSLRSH